MTTEEVLKLLQASPAHISGEQISKALNISRAAVWKAVKQLQQAGYEIEAAPRRGYRLASLPDRLDAAKIAACLPDHPWLPTVQIFEEIGSTNTFAKQLAAEGAAAGTVILAERQTAGRGRLGRSFCSEPGGLYMSVILRPGEKPEALMHLTAAAAVAAMRAVEESCGVKADIKWTNDLVVGRRKLCGILTELSMDFDTRLVDAVIIGIGINCNQASLDPAISDMATTLRQETGAAVDRNLLAANLICAFYALSETLLSQKEDWLRRFRERCITPGQDVKLIRGYEVRFAHAEAIGPDAELIVRLPDGSTEAIASGEVSVRGMYGYTN